MPRRHPQVHGAVHWQLKCAETVRQDAAMRGLHKNGLCWLCARQIALANASATIRRLPWCHSCQSAADQKAAENGAG
jgi:hypothetical protein